MLLVADSCSLKSGSADILYGVWPDPSVWSRSIDVGRPAYRCPDSQVLHRRYAQSKAFYSRVEPRQVIKLHQGSEKSGRAAAPLRDQHDRARTSRTILKMSKVRSERLPAFLDEIDEERFLGDLSFVRGLPSIV